MHATHKNSSKKKHIVYTFLILFISRIRSLVITNTTGTIKSIVIYYSNYKKIKLIIYDIGIVKITKKKSN